MTRNRPARPPANYSSEPMTGDAPSTTTQEPARAAQGRRVPLLSVAAVVIALIVGIIVASGGHRGLVVQTVDDGDLSLLVPAGWQSENLVAPHGSAVSGWFDVGNPTESEVVQASEPARGTPRGRARALARAKAHEAGYLQVYLGVVVFPGGRRAWEVLYSVDKAPFAVFEYDVCSPAIAMTVTLSASSFGSLKGNEAARPQDAFAICNGAAFTSPDRADLAIPLTLPS